MNAKTKFIEKSKRTILISLMLISTFILSCEKDNIDGEVTSDTKFEEKLYSLSVDTLALNTSEYILETFLARDFFPGGPISEQRPLVALVFLVNLDSLAIPENLTITKLYVINSHLIWITNVKKSGDNYLPNYKLEFKNTNGPEWNTEIYVDVIVEIENNLTSETHYLIARHQYIERSE
jgi:hypothetical protein